MEEIAGTKASDSSGNDHPGQLEDGVALFLPGAESPGLAAACVLAAVELALLRW